MSAGEPNAAANRIRRGSPASQPAAGRAVSGNVRIQPIRITIDLSPADHDQLSDWTHTERVRKADAVRALIRLLDDPEVAERVRAHLPKRL